MGQGSSTMEEGKVYFFPDPNFQGTPFVVSDPLTLLNVTTKGAPANELSSLVIPDGFEVFLYRQANLQGDHRHFRGPVKIANLTESAFDDATASVIVAKSAGAASSTPTETQVALYFQGRGGAEGLLLEAPLDISNITRLGIPNNSLTQVKLGSNVALTVYDKHNFYGDNATFNGAYVGGLDKLAGRVSSFRATLQQETKLAETSSTSWGVWIALLIILILIGLLIYSKTRN